ncbi:GAP family protein [Mycobacterium sp. SP-6446]|uniref:GAP family protein n=1 Tax=Mycobacterium sp. SP-6446 TaxID=1834162 RepID=UPI00096CCA52|nr:GAP family protein [Mycobacterium sp. SP-6446]OMC19296.1 hypothetical protein A5736_13295 [Mycobacterium sp. SP-6446]
MWGSLLGFALFVTFHPVRLAVILLLISRSRPLQNLFVYWVGCITANLPSYLVPLVVLHITPTFASFTKDVDTPGTVANSIARQIETGVGVLALLIAALMAVRFSARQRATVPAAGGNTSTLVLDSNPPSAISRLLGRTQDAPTEGGSPIRRLIRWAGNIWQGGSLWVAFVVGISSAPSLEAVLIVDAIIVASGASIGMQFGVAIAFVFGIFALEEVILISYLAKPAKTHAALQLLHNWALAHRPKILIAIAAIVGATLVAHGIGAI